VIGPVRRVLGAVLAALATVGLVALSRVPITAVRSEDAELRLAWRYRSERVRECRTRSQEELAKLPAHMRIAQDCERRVRPYVLDVAVDGRPAARDTVRAAGAQSDRPLVVFRRIALAPGRHSARVTFAPLEGSAAVPLRFESELTLGPRRVALVTLDQDRGVLVVRQH
jgi:hypothetical protein